jgi:hypothetical protein
MHPAIRQIARSVLTACLLSSTWARAADMPTPVVIVPDRSYHWTALQEFPNPAGRLAVATVDESAFDTHNNPFFEAAPNGRACVTCHQPRNAMSLSVDTIRGRWRSTGGKDPLFAAVDASNCPSLPQGLESSHSLLLERGVFRIRAAWPPRAPDGSVIQPEIDIEVVSDPTGCNTSPVYGMHSAAPTISVYRRPRMVANLRYVDTPKYDYNAKLMMPLDRDPETGAHSSMSMTADGRVTSLRSQAIDAMRTHMEMVGPLPEEKLARILQFEQHLYVAQNYSSGAGDLTETGGPRALGVKAMIDGKDHMNGYDKDTGVFFFFDQWKHPTSVAVAPAGSRTEFRESVARGYDVFFNRPFWISDTFGINNIRLGNPFKNACGFCHNSQLTGVDDVPGWMDLGTTNFPHAPESPDLPLFKVTCKPTADPHPYLGRVIYTTDPGRALVSGRCEDVGGIVMQQFRGIAARAPYFSDGSAKTLREVVDFYDRRYNIGYTEREKQDLVNFLSVL